MHNRYQRNDGLEFVPNRRFDLVPLGVEINPQFYWGKIKALAYENKTAYDIIVNGLATALLKYQGGFKQC